MSILYGSYIPNDEYYCFKTMENETHLKSFWYGLYVDLPHLYTYTQAMLIEMPFPNIKM